MPEEGVALTPNEELLTASEIGRLARLFAAEGVDKVRLTGGEPTVRRDLAEIIGNLKAVPGIEKVGITTNGIALKRKLESLKAAGLDVINISLDTLVAAKYDFITRRSGLATVIECIDMATEMDFDAVKINCVVMRGLNDDELQEFVAMTASKPVDVRFIEYMPFDGNRWNDKKFFSYEDQLDVIRGRFPDIARLGDGPNDVSKAWQVPGHVGTVGFITSMSEHFCGTCNRLRLTADGNLKVCLFGNAEVSLRDALRSGASEDDIKVQGDRQISSFRASPRAPLFSPFSPARDPMLTALSSPPFPPQTVISAAVKGKKAAHAGMYNIAKSNNRPMITIGG